jgi:hypothetical protein
MFELVQRRREYRRSIFVSHILEVLEMSFRGLLRKGSKKLKYGRVEPDADEDLLALASYDAQQCSY